MCNISVSPHPTPPHPTPPPTPTTGSRRPAHMVQYAKLEGPQAVDSPSSAESGPAPGNPVSLPPSLSVSLSLSLPLSVAVVGTEVKSAEPRIEAL